MSGKIKIRPFGNSAGVIIPKEELERLQLRVGDELTLRRSDGGLELTPYDADFEHKVEALERSRRKFRNAYRELAK